MESLEFLCKDKIFRLMSEKQEEIMSDLYFYMKKCCRKIRWFLVVRIYKNLKILREFVRCHAWSFNRPMSDSPLLYPLDDGCLHYYLNKLWEGVNVISFRTLHKIILQTRRKYRTSLRHWWYYDLRKRDCNSALFRLRRFTKMTDSEIFHIVYLTNKNV